MIGERLESQRKLPLGALLLLITGVGVGATGWVFGNHDVVTAAVLPLALGLTFFVRAQERFFTATFRDEGLEIESTGEPTLVRYQGIRNITVGGRPADPAGFAGSSCPITVVHESGLLNIPARLNFPSHEVYRFLAARVPETGGREVNPVLGEYLKREEQQFGPDAIWTFRAASQRVPGGRPGYRTFFIGLIVAAAGWIVLGFSGFAEVIWGVAGIVCAFVAASFHAASSGQAMAAAPALKNWKNASLVIGPRGMAMVQGNIQGEVCWPELLEIRFRTKPSGFNLGHPNAIPGIILRVKGASILIADVYDRPLYVIHNRILAMSGR
jgi:hypothetical protein